MEKYNEVICHPTRPKEYKVIVADEPTKNFRSVTIGDISLVTQNLRKPSPNTDWVKADPNRKLTWIFKNGNYAGKVETTQNHKLYTLNPDRVVYSCE